MKLRTKAIIVSVPVFVLNALIALVAATHQPLRSGTSAEFWEYLCGVRLQSFRGHHPYGKEGGIYPSRGFRGVSLALAPLATGAVMKTLGDWRRRQGKEVTLLATFWGGSAFAFALSLARLLSLRST